MKVYTKKGDKGETSLIGGKRVLKNHIRVNAYGTIDELISSIGIVRAYITETYYKEFLLKIQNNLMNVASILSAEGDFLKKIPEVKEIEITEIEKEIDKISQTLPALRYFVIPGNNIIEAHIHLSRTICRRAERIVVAMIEEKYTIPENILTYLNRLSDFLFVFARKMDSESQDTLWIPKIE